MDGIRWYHLPLILLAGFLGLVVRGIKKVKQWVS